MLVAEWRYGFGYSFRRLAAALKLDQRTYAFFPKICKRKAH